jgi:hypothetical protein
VDVVRHQIRKTIETEEAAVGIVGIEIRIREMRDNDSEKSGRLDNSGKQVHQSRDIFHMLEKVIRIDGRDRGLRNLGQDFVDIPNYVNAFMIQSIDAKCLRVPFATAAAQLQ